MENIKNLLPVGSVVRVKEAEKNLMVIGILMENAGNTYDYAAFLHPEGYIDEEHLYLFNHEDVEEVLFIGYMNAEFQVFRGTLAYRMGEKEEPVELM